MSVSADSRDRLAYSVGEGLGWAGEAELRGEAVRPVSPRRRGGAIGRRRLSTDAERVGGETWTPPWVRREHQARFDFAARMAAGQDVLDCACGSGAGSSVFLDAKPRSFRGLDLSAEAVAAARARCADGDGAFVIAAATGLPLADDTVDVYVSLETIEHVDDDRAYLAEAARVLRDGGRFVCSTPNRNVTNPGTTIEAKPFNPFHVREYDPGELIALLSTAFGRVELYGQNPRRRARTTLARMVARVLSPALAARIRQVMKLPLLVLDHQARHVVEPCDPRREYEYLVAVCSDPCLARA
jgi:SAM-dependent methyltransferase